MSNIVPFEQQVTLARAFVQSGLFGVKNESQALALMALCEAEGMHPARAIQEFHIVQGRPAMKADAMLARFQQAGGMVEWVEYTDKKVSGKFSHSVNSPTPVLVEWTIEQATKAGLAGKDNWKNYPRAMLRARVISEGIRATNPAVCVGVYTPEEVQDMEPVRKEKVINPVPAAPKPLSDAALSKMLSEFSLKGFDEQKVCAAIGHDKPWTRAELNDAWAKLVPAEDI